MPLLKSLLSLLAMGSVMIEDPVPQNLVSKVLRTVALVVVTSVLFVALLLTGFVSLYHYLLSLNIPELDASLYIMGGIAALTAIAGLITVRQACCLKQSLRHSIKKPVPLTSHLTDEVTTVVKSFFNGLMSKTPSSF